MNAVRPAAAALVAGVAGLAIGVLPLTTPTAAAVPCAEWQQMHPGWPCIDTPSPPPVPPPGPPTTSPPLPTPVMPGQPPSADTGGTQAGALTPPPVGPGNGTPIIAVPGAETPAVPAAPPATRIQILPTSPPAGGEVVAPTTVSPSAPAVTTAPPAGAILEPTTTPEVRQQHAASVSATPRDARPALLMILGVAAFGAGAWSISRRTASAARTQSSGRGILDEREARQNNNLLIHQANGDPPPPADPNPPKDLAPGKQEWSGDTRYREQGYESNSYAEWVPDHPGATTGTVRMGIGQQPADASWTTTGVDVWIDDKYQHLMPREVAPGTYLIEVPNVRIGQKVQFSGKLTGQYQRGRRRYQAETDITGIFTPRLTVNQRLDVLYQRLQQSAPAKTADEALNQVSTTLDGVEDDYSGVPRNPNPGKDWDGRMYPPREDNIIRNPDGSIVARTRGSDINIGRDGSIEIVSKTTGEVKLSKPGGGQ